MKAVLGSGATTVVSSDGFYIDDTPPIFDPDVMGSDIYIDVYQGEFTPVRYQGSNNTIKAFWRCFDEESDIVVSTKCLTNACYKEGVFDLFSNHCVKHI